MRTHCKIFSCLIVLFLALSKSYASDATVTLSSYCNDGPNPTTLPLNEALNFSASVGGASNHSVTWSVNGAGSISQQGVYSPPATLPSNPKVTVVAALQEYPSITASYSFSLENPLAVLTSVSPNQLVSNTTNPVVVYGKHFVPNMTIMVNGKAVTTTVVNSNKATVAIAIPKQATGTYQIAAQNPAPGGGGGNSMTMAVAAESISLTANDSDGTNTGTVRLGSGVSITAQVTAPGDQTLSWSLSGAGTIDSSSYGSSQTGTWYAPGTTLPQNSTVTVTATLVQNPAIQASYTAQIINSVPAISSVAPTQLQSDQTQTIAIAGRGFVPGAVVIFNGQAVPTTYLSYGHLTAQVFVPDSAVAPISVQVQNPTPGGGMGNVVATPVAVKTVGVAAYNAGSISPTSVALGQTLQLTDWIISGPGDTSCTWTIQGAGTISPTGLYQAPTSMPGNPTVTVTAALLTNPAAQASYTFTLAYPTPVISSTNPPTLEKGETASFQIYGSGFTPMTAFYVNGQRLTKTYNSPTMMTASVSAPAGQSGSLILTAENPGTGQSNSFALPIGGPASASATISVTPGLAIPANFLGFSHEWPGLQWYMGTSALGPNYVYRQLIKNLMNGDEYPFFIRIGGDSADAYTTPQPTLAQAELSEAIGAQFSLSVNLQADEPQAAVAQAQAYVEAMPAGSLAAIEIGNEPDNYQYYGYRPSNYITGKSEQPYLNDLATWSCDIYPVASSTPLMGPAFGSIYTLIHHINSFEAQEAPNPTLTPAGCPSGKYNPMSIVSVHVYGGYLGSSPLANNFLLQPSSSTWAAQALAPDVATLHQHGQTFRIGEFNSVDGGGQTGLSDTFQAALWITDTMFEFAKVGIDGVNIHGNTNCAYCTFQWNQPYIGNHNQYIATNIAPAYYGMLLFQRAATHGARLLPVSVEASANIKVWATQDKTGAIHVIVLNKDQSFSGNVSISLPGYGPAQLSQLLAPGYQATSGITFAGQTFDNSYDGTPQGEAVNQSLDPENGVYTVSVTPVSAVLLDIPANQ